MNDSSPDDVVDLRAYWRPIWARRWWILAFVILVTTAVYRYEAAKPKIFQSATSVFLQPSDAESLFASQAAATQQLRTSANQAQLLRSRTIAGAVKRELKTAASPDALRARIDVASDSSTDFVTITATGATGQSAADLANAYAKAFVESRDSSVARRLLRERQQIGAQLQAVRGTGRTAEQQRTKLRARIREVKAVGLTANGGATQVDSAVAASAPIEPNPGKVARFAALLALVFAVFLAVLAQRMDRRLATDSDLEELYGLPVLGTVPHVDEPAPIIGGKAVFSPLLREPMRMLRLNLALQTIDQPATTLLLTSAIPSEGKSTIARNLALAMAEAGQKVAVVEADLRRPTLASRFGVERDRGLTAVLAAEVTLDEALIPVALGDAPTQDLLGGALYLLPGGSGASNPPAVLGSSRMREILARLAKDYDVVVIDSPPLLAVADTLSLLPLVSAVLLVGRIDLTTSDAIGRVKALLERSPGGRVVGLVANSVSGGAGYGYGYEYGAMPNGASATTRSSRAIATAD